MLATMERPAKRTKTLAMLPTPSAEQSHVLKLMATHNVITNAAPGGGKTTLAMHVASAFPDEKVLIVPYNTALSEATNISIIETFGSNNRVKCMTYHSLLGKLTGGVCCDDLAFHKLIDENIADINSDDWLFSDMSILVLDEVQDMRSHYWSLVQHLLKHIIRSPQKLKILMVGDTNQMLYDFFAGSSADARFLTLADKLLANVSTRPWENVDLPTSYRLTPPMTSFVNYMTNNSDQKPIIPSPFKKLQTPDAPPVELYVVDIKNDMPALITRLITDAVKDSNVSYGDIMVLVSSCNSKSPAIAAVRLLVDANVPVHVVRSGDLVDMTSATRDVGSGKVKISTFHSTKGTERKVVFILFDRQLFGLDELPKPWFVGLTRSARRLVCFVERRYVYQNDLDDLTTNMYTDELYVEVRSNLAGPVRPDEPPKTYTRTRYHTRDLYSFADAIDQLTLLDNVAVIELQDAIEDEIDDDDHPAMQSFDAVTTVSFDGGITFHNVALIVLQALQLSVEHEIRTCKHTPRIEPAPVQLGEHR